MAYYAGVPSKDKNFPGYFTHRFTGGLTTPPESGCTGGRWRTSVCRSAVLRGFTEHKLKDSPNIGSVATRRMFRDGIALARLQAIHGQPMATWAYARQRRGDEWTSGAKSSESSQAMDSGTGSWRVIDLSLEVAVETLAAKKPFAAATRAGAT